MEQCSMRGGTNDPLAHREILTRTADPLTGVVWGGWCAAEGGGEAWQRKGWQATLHKSTRWASQRACEWRGEAAVRGRKRTVAYLLHSQALHIPIHAGERVCSPGQDLSVNQDHWRSSCCTVPSIDAVYPYRSGDLQWNRRLVLIILYPSLLFTIPALIFGLSSYYHHDWINLFLFIITAIERFIFN